MPEVQCPNCKKICHETTDTYDPAIRANGGMVKLLEPWASWGWGKFGDHRNGGAEVIASDMECPCCEAPLAPSGRLRVVSDTQGKTEAEKATERLIEMYRPRIMDGGDEIRIPLETAPPFICDVDGCGKVCKTERGLKMHKRSHE